ncbi:PREDICTED: ABC transporter B family member 26, chloroplastic-like [Ipomoea nil]|uniref:ABC transporter B family member 26, chloroplastic-like n=1 Tax=Ipomoea nil TaxID=35883 RepID=UPI000901406F|nr:PREDICTED: ABC transporter B family member 26, chloroplastic-like [Ipomoea nil]
MAISKLNLYTHTCRQHFQNTVPFPVISKSSNFSVKTELRFPYSPTIQDVRIRFHSFICSSNSTLGNEILVPTGHGNTWKSENEILGSLRNWVDFINSVFPGGSWWSLRDCKEEDGYPNEEKPITGLNALCRMWEFIADGKWAIYTGFGALTVAALAEIRIPSVLAASIFSAQRGETMLLYRNLKLLVLLSLISGICSGLRRGCLGYANTTMLKNLRKRLFGSVLSQDISFFDRRPVGELTSRLGTDCQRLSNTIGNDIHMMVRSTIQGTGALIHLMSLSLPLALSTIIICFVLSTVFLVYSRYQKKAAKLTQEFTALTVEAAQEAFSLVRTIRTYGMEREEEQRFNHCLQRLACVGMRESVANGFWNLSFNGLYRSTQVFAVMLGGMSIMTGHISAEQLTKYVLYCEWLIFAAWRVQDNMSSFLQSVGACEKVFQLLDLFPSDQHLSQVVKRLTRSIQFVNVSFQYPSRKMVPCLKNVSFSIQANEVTAIVGSSGSGKSTLINLLLRLYEPTDGQIMIDDFALRELDISWLRRNIGYVGQEPHLFHLDIKSNISYGCSKSATREDIERAAKQAYAHEFICSLPHGYDTIVDDHLLSGGQKQRIALARAILRDPTILILDEATSALDAESEYYIKEFLHALKHDNDGANASRSVIVIANRLSMIEVADKVVVLDRGEVVEMGTHCDLIRQNGMYAKIVKMQTDMLP